MKLTHQHGLLLAINLAYVIGFGSYFLLAGNYEFVWYVGVLVAFLALIGGTLRISHLPNHILWFLTVWGFLHMAGGGIRVGEQVLYAYVLIPFVVDGEFSIFKYDQFVHMYGFGVAAVAAHFLLSQKIKGYISAFWLSVTCILVAMGLGVINEMIEFAAVLASPSTGVGGYVNTSLDLVFNTIGAVVAMLILYVLGKHKQGGVS